MKKSILDLTVGLAVITIATIFVLFVYKNSISNYENQGDAYHVQAKFQDVTGIIEGSDVTIAGIKVGNVAKMRLDPQTYDALIVLEINKKIKIPKDSKAAIVTSGFVGNKLISIDPGSEEIFLQEGDQILYTTSALSLESLIGKFIYSMSGSKSSQ